MKRYLCWLALLGIVALPDWASAFYPRRWCAPPPCYSGPAYYPPPQPVYVPPCVPVYEVPPLIYPAYPIVQQPRVIVDTTGRAAGPTSTPRRAAPVITEDSVRPASATATPAPAPGPNPVAAPVTGVAAPKKPAGLPALVMPGGSATATPAPGAPTPEPGSKDKIPATVPRIPEVPGPNLPIGGGDSLPPLVLPPDAPAAGNPSAQGTTAKSSPLAGDTKSTISAQVFAARGALAPAGTRRVGFFNHTGQDIELVIEGRTVTLPARTYLHAEVAPTFRWKYANNPARTETVPDGNTGLDVLFRE